MVARLPRLVRSIVLGSLISLIFLSAPAEAVTYRWMTPDGAVHFGDAMPSDQAERGYDIIDPVTGEVKEHIDRAKTPQELAEMAAKQKAQEAAARKAAQKQAAQEKYDKMLLDLYSSRADIMRMRDSRLAEIDKQIQQAQGQLKRLEAHSKAGSLTDSAAAIPESLKIRRHIAELQDERERVDARFAADLKRFQVLKPGR